MNRVANVYMGNSIQIGSLPVEQHEEIVSRVKKDVRLYVLQAVNYITVLVNSYITTLKYFFVAALLMNAAYYVNGDIFYSAAIKSLKNIFLGNYKDGDVEMVSAFFNGQALLFMDCITNGAVVSIIFVATLIVVTFRDFSKCQSIGKVRQEDGFFGYKNYFMQSVDNEIKTLLQEQADGRVWVVYEDEGNEPAAISHG